VCLLQALPKPAKAQEFPWTLQYMTNMNTINPAYVGMYDIAGFTLSTRKDYVSINGSNTYQQFTYKTPIRDSESGIAFNFIKRTVGFEKQLYLTFDYSYQVRLDMYNYLRFGFRGGIVNYSNNLTDYHLYPDGIPDSQFMVDINNYFMTAFGAGAIIFNDNYYVGLSVPQFINNTFQVNRKGYSSLQEFKTAYLTGGYLFRLPFGVQFRPNALLIGTVGKRPSFDLGGVVYLPNNLNLGINARNTGAFCLSAQYVFPNNIKIGFAADYALFQDIRKFQVGTYEVNVSYEFNIYRKTGGRPNYF
jgi:type IX secretion system PorP/SprF family membrane protein